MSEFYIIQQEDFKIQDEFTMIRLSANRYHEERIASLRPRASSPLSPEGHARWHLARRSRELPLRVQHVRKWPEAMTTVPAAIASGMNHTQLYKAQADN